MCGIIGYTGKRNGIPIIYNALKTLSYRGYDSWGIAAANNAELTIHKNTGDICRTELPSMMSNKVIGHTRWATHGGVTKVNAHPHTSTDKKISIVHNGIIENYMDLKAALEDEGCKFESETDTEAIVHLISHFAKKHDFKRAFRDALTNLKGSYAILAMDADGKIAFARKGSPLVLGIGKDEIFISSDIPSFLTHTKNIVCLEDGDYGYIENNLEIYNDGQRVHRVETQAPWDIEVAKKGQYQHFMLKEIEEQSITIRKSLNQPEEIIAKTAEMMKKASAVYLAGCGTSYNTCAIASYQFAKAKVKTIPVLASEFEKHLPFIDENSLLIAVSQSGETKDLIDAISQAKEKGATIAGIINVPSSTIARTSDIAIHMHAGPELCVLSTKSSTSQLAIFSLLAFELQKRNHDILYEAAAMVPHVIRESRKTIKKVAKKIAKNNSLFVIGRNALSQSAREAALKIKEVSYIHAEGFAAGELKHGSIALIDYETPVIVFADNETRELSTSNAMEVKARGAFVIGIDSKNSKAYDVHIPIPEIDDMTPILALIPAQLLAYHLALERKCNPDKPRNLAKSVTVK